MSRTPAEALADEVLDAGIAALADDALAEFRGLIAG